MRNHLAKKMDSLGTRQRFEVLDMRGKKGFPEGDEGFVYILKYSTELPQRYTGIPKKWKRTFIIRTDDSNKGWRIDKSDMGIPETVRGLESYYRTPQEAAKKLVGYLEGLTEYKEASMRGSATRYEVDGEMLTKGQMMSRAKSKKLDKKAALKKYRVGDPVLYRGQYSTRFSIRGTVEKVTGDGYWVRLENGNPAWASPDQLKPAGKTAATRQKIKKLRKMATSKPTRSSDLRQAVVKLALENPDGIRRHLVPILREARR